MRPEVKQKNLGLGHGVRVLVKRRRMPERFVIITAATATTTATATTSATTTSVFMRFSVGDLLSVSVS